MQTGGQVPSSDANDPADEMRRSYVVTITLLSVIVFVFIIETVSALSSYSFDSRSSQFDTNLLIKLGALGRQLVFAEGEWWRLITAPLLHAGPLHVFLNGLALLLIGPRLESVVGKAWFFAVFSVSCVSGALFSLLFNSSTVISVGASGGIMGLFGTAFVVSFRLKSGSDFRKELQMDATRVLIPTLLPVLLMLVAGGTQDGVDVAAHLGGALSGFGFGLFLLSRHAELEGLQALLSQNSASKSAS
jgi:rhomboid protease GluP